MAFLKEKAFEMLAAAADHGRLAHGYLITGERGAGKTELAEALCDLVGGRSEPVGFRREDVFVLKPESKSRRIVIDRIRELEGHLRMRTKRGCRKVGVLFEAERMQEAAANAFLKTLEEPPADTLLLLLSAQPEMLLDTILSRCIEIRLRPGSRRALTGTESRMAALLAGQAGGGAGGALGLAAGFLGLLAALRDETESHHAELLRDEHRMYSKTTDSEKWLKEREEYYKALTESHVSRERSLLLDVAGRWWADVLRHRMGREPELAEWAEHTARLAEVHPIPRILASIEAINETRDMLERNVNEPLAVESGFLRAFGGGGEGS